MSAYLNVSVDGIVLSASANKLSCSVSLNGVSGTYPAMTMLLAPEAARRIAAELIAAANAVEQALSSTPSTETADSLPADGGAFLPTMRPTA